MLGIHKPNPKYANLHVTHDIPVEPKSVVSSNKHLGWSTTMEEKLAVSVGNQTWTLIPYDPSMNVEGCHWVYKAKLKPNDLLERLKAWLIAKDFNKVDDIDFFETFSPIIKLTSIRLIPTVAVVRKWELRQLEMKNAFLLGHLSQLIYM